MYTVAVRLHPGTGGKQTLCTNDEQHGKDEDAHVTDDFK
jgi:hypothetical protein